MQVQHQPVGPDQLCCVACGVAFEVEADGACLHVTLWPDSFAGLREQAADRWLTVTELRTLVRPAVPSPDPRTIASPIKPVQPLAAPSSVGPKPLPSKTGVTPVSTPTASNKNIVTGTDLTEMAVRVQKLRSLGNTSAQIKAILLKTETDPEKIKAIPQVIGQVERQDQNRQGKKLMRSIGILVVVVVVFIITGFFLQRSYANRQPQQTMAPLQATLMPNLAKVLRLDTPLVQYGVAPPAAANSSSCPFNGDEAAALFGGQPENWSSPPGTHGWIMIDQIKPATIYIPKGMTAAYLQLGSAISLVQISGPVQLGNIYYVAISCP
jgi:hypothetical protein